MRVVVTRPQADGERTAAALEALGHEVLVAPLMRIEPVAVDLAGTWSAIVITSANALQAAPATADKTLPVFAVGDRSAEAARRAGFSEVSSANGDIKDLVRLSRRACCRREGSVALSRRRGSRRRSCGATGGTWHRCRDEGRLSNCRRSLSPRSWPPRLKPAMSTPCCTFPAAAPNSLLKVPGRQVSPARRRMCDIFVCLRRLPSRSPARAALPSLPARKKGL